MAMFPEWGYYAPGIAPMLAISVAYVISGPATADPLARRLWKHAWEPATPTVSHAGSAARHRSRLVNGPEIAIEPAQDLLDHFVSRDGVVRFIHLEPFVLGRRSQ